MPEISVIIPVYNTARFLPACLDSVLDQTFADTEIICVDDGSTDDSLQILRRYEKRDGRVKVLTQRTARQGAARNRGLEIAAGRYVMFVDSDDWLDNDALEVLYCRAAADDADIVLTGTRLYDENGGSLGRDYMNFEGWAGWQNGIPAEKFFAVFAPVCGRLYKTAFLRQNRLRFAERCFYEDNSWGCLVGILATRVSFVRNVYCYRRHPGSTTGTKDAKVFDWVKDFDFFCRERKKRRLRSPLVKCAFFWYLKSFDWYLRQLPPADQRIFYGRICRRLKRLQLKKEDFARAPLPAGEAGKLLMFWQWLKQKDFDRCRQLNVYFCGVLLYRIKTRPDGSRSDHLLFGALPFFSRRRRAVQK